MKYLVSRLSTLVIIVLTFGQLSLAEYNFNELLQEYNTLHAEKNRPGHSTGFIQVVEAQQTIVASVISVRENVEGCYELREIIPNLSNGEYRFQTGGGEVETRRCQTLEDFAAPAEPWADNFGTRGNVRGFIDRIDVQPNGNAIVRGWTCQQYLKNSLEYRVFAGGPAGTGTYIGNGIADRPAEAGLARYCLPLGGVANPQFRHRFAHVIPASVVREHAGKAIHIHGIAVRGSSINRQLGYSGSHRLPEVNDAPGVVTGWLGQVLDQDDNIVLTGWACQINVADQLNVHVYVGGPAGRGRMIASGRANLNGEAAIGQQCHASSNHRFRISIAKSRLANYQGQGIYVHGIAADRSASNNFALKRRATHVVPTIADTSPGAITGFVDVVQRQADGTVRIAGWACQKNVNRSIPVHVYVGGAAGRGQILMGGSASRPSSSTISGICNTTVAHRYLVIVPADKARQHSGKTVFVHGIQNVRAPGGNATLTKSGRFRMP